MLCRPAPLLAALGLLMATGCTQFPELDHTQTTALDKAEYPALVPIEPILAGITPAGDTAQLAQDNIDGRLSALRSRADRLRSTVLSAEEKRRLQQGLR